MNSLIQNNNKPSEASPFRDISKKQIELWAHFLEKIRLVFLSRVSTLSASSKAMGDTSCLDELLGLYEAENREALGVNASLEKPLEIFTFPAIQENLKLFQALSLDFIAADALDGADAQMQKQYVDLLINSIKRFKDLHKSASLDKWNSCLNLLKTIFWPSDSSPEELAIRISNLKGGESLLVACRCDQSVGSGHALYCKFTRQIDQNYTITIYNTGSGLQFHARGHQDRGKLLACRAVQFVDILPEELCISPSGQVFPEFTRALCSFFTEMGKNTNTLSQLDERDLGDVKLSTAAHFYALFKPFENRMKRNYISSEFATIMRAGNCSYKALLAVLSDGMPKEEYKLFKFELSLNSLRAFFAFYRKAISPNYKESQGRSFVFSENEPLKVHKHAVMRYLLKEAAHKFLRRLAKLIDPHRPEQSVVPHARAILAYKESLQILASLAEIEKEKLESINLQISYDAEVEKKQLTKALGPFVSLDEPLAVSPFVFVNIEFPLLNPVKLAEQLESFYVQIESIWQREPDLVRLRIEQFVNFEEKEDPHFLSFPHKNSLFWNQVSPDSWQECQTKLRQILQIYASICLPQADHLPSSQYTAYRLMVYIHFLSEGIASKRNQVEIASFLAKHPSFPLKYAEWEKILIYAPQAEVLAESRRLKERYFQGKEQNSLFHFSEDFREPLQEDAEIYFLQAVVKAGGEDLGRLFRKEQEKFKRVWETSYSVGMKEALILLVHKEVLPCLKALEYVANLREAAFIIHAFGTYRKWSREEPKVELVVEVKYKDKVVDIRYDCGERAFDNPLLSQNLVIPSGNREHSLEAALKDKVNRNSLAQGAFSHLLQEVYSEGELRIRYDNEPDYAKQDALPLDLLAVHCGKEALLQKLFYYFSSHEDLLLNPLYRLLFLLIFSKIVYKENGEESFPLSKDASSIHFIDQFNIFIQKGLLTFYHKKAHAKPDLHACLFLIKIAYRLQRLNPDVKTINTNLLFDQLESLLKVSEWSDKEKASIHLHRILLYQTRDQASLSTQALSHIVYSWFFYSMASIEKEHADPVLIREMEQYIGKILPLLDNFLISKEGPGCLLRLLADVRKLEVDHQPRFSISHERFGLYFLSLKGKGGFVFNLVKGEIGAREEGSFSKKVLVKSHNATAFVELFGGDAVFEGEQRGDWFFFRDEKGRSFKILFDKTTYRSQLFMKISEGWYLYYPKAGLSESVDWAFRESQLPPILKKGAFFRGEEGVYIYDFVKDQLLAKINPEGEILLAIEGKIDPQEPLKALLMNSLERLNPLFGLIENEDYILGIQRKGELSSIQFPRLLSIEGERSLEFAFDGKRNLPFLWTENPQYRLSCDSYQQALFGIDRLTFNALILVDQTRGRKKCLIPLKRAREEQLPSPYVQIDVDAPLEKKALFSSRHRENELYAYLEYDLIEDRLEPLSTESKLFLVYLSLHSRQYLRAKEYLDNLVLGKDLSKWSLFIFQWIKEIEDLSPMASAVKLKAEILYQKKRSGSPISATLDLVQRYFNGRQNIPPDMHLLPQEEALLPGRLIPLQEGLPLIPVENLTRETPLRDLIRLKSDVKEMIELLQLVKKSNDPSSLGGMFDLFLELYSLSLTHLDDKTYFFLLSRLRFGSLHYSQHKVKKWYSIGYGSASWYRIFNEFLKQAVHLALRYPKEVKAIGDFNANDLDLWYNKIVKLYNEKYQAEKEKEVNPHSSHTGLIESSKVPPSPYSLARLSPSTSLVVKGALNSPIERGESLPPLELLIGGSGQESLVSSCFRQNAPATAKEIDKGRLQIHSNELTKIEAPFERVISEDIAAFAHEVYTADEKSRKEVPYQLKDQQSQAFLKNSVVEWCSKKEKQLDSLKRSLLILASKRPPHEGERFQRRLLEEGHALSPPNLTSLLGTFLQNNFQAYALLNNSLDEAEIQTLDALLLNFFVETTYLTRAKHLLELLEKREAPNLSPLECQVLDADMATILQEKMAYDPHLARVCLVYEYLAKIRIREEQMTLITKMVEEDGGRYKDTVAQLMMGGGKTTVIAAILLYLSSQKEGKFAVFIPPAAQFSTQCLNLAITQKTYFGQEVIALEAARDTLTEGRLKEIHQIILRAKSTKSVLLMKKDQVQIFYLSYLSFLAEGDQKNPCIPLLSLILQEFKKGAQVIGDEIDKLLNSAEEINFPTGAKSTVNPLFVDLARMIFEIHLSEESLLSNGRSIESVLNLTKNEQNFVSPIFYKEEILPLITSKLLERHADLKKFLAYPESAMRYLLGQTEETKDAPFLAFLEGCAESKDEEKKLAADLMAVARLFFTQVLPLTLTKSNRRHYGRSSQDGMGKVVPFGGVEVEAETEFGNVWELMSYYFLVALSEGILPTQIKFLADQLRLSAISYARKQNVEFDQTPEALQFFNLTGVFLAKIYERGNLEKAAAFVNQDTGKKMELQSELVCAQASSYTTHLNSNAQNFVELFDTFRGFSGTTWNTAWYATPLTKNVFLDRAVEGRVASTFLRREAPGSIQFIDNVDIKKIFTQLIKTHKEPHRIRCLIDVGGLFKEFANEQMAKEILEYYKDDPSVQSVLYFGKGRASDLEPHTLMAWVKGKERPVVIGSTLKEEIEKKGIDLSTSFTVFDESHTEATNISLPKNCVGIVALGERLTIRSLLQALLRLRLFFTTQDTLCIAHHKARDSFLGGASSLSDVLRSCVKAQAILRARENVRSYRQKLRHVIQAALLERFLSAGPEAAIELFEQYKPFVIGLQNKRPYEEFGQITRLVETKKSLVGYGRALLGELEKIEKGQTRFFLDVYRRIGALFKEVEKDMALPDQEEERGVSSDTLGMQQEVDLQREVEREQEMQVELQRELQSYQQRGGWGVRNEILWTKELLLDNKFLLSFSKPKSEIPHKVIEIYQVAELLEGVEYEKPYSKIFPSNLLVTSNFAFTKDELLPVFHAYQKPAHQILVIRGEKQLFALFLSIQELATIKSLVEENLPSGLFNHLHLVMPDGSFVFAPPEDFSFREREELEKLLWWVNLWNGQASYLAEQESLSMQILGSAKFVTESLRESELSKRWLELRVFTDPVQKSIFYRTPFLSEGIQGASGLLKCRLRRLEEEKLKKMKLRPLEEWDEKEILHISNLKPKDLVQIRSQVLIQTFSYAQVVFASASQASRFTSTQVLWVAEQQKGDLFSAAVAASGLHPSYDNAQFWPLLQGPAIEKIMKDSVRVDIVPYLNRDQIRFVPVQTLQALGSPRLTDAQVVGVRGLQVPYIEDRQISLLSKEEQIQGISLEKIPSLPLEFRYYKFLKKEQIGVVTPEQVVKLQTFQLPFIPLTKEHLAKVLPKFFPHLSDAHLHLLDKEQIDNAPKEIIHRLSVSQIPWLSTGEQLDCLVNSPNLIKAITVRQIHEYLLSASVVKKLTDPTRVQELYFFQLDQLEPHQIPLIKDTQVQFIYIRAQMKCLKEEHIANVTPEQIKRKLLTKDQIQKLRKEEQIQAVEKEDVPHLLPEQIEHISPTQVKYLIAKEQLENLPKLEEFIQEITPEQIQGQLLSEHLIQSLVLDAQIQAVLIEDVKYLTASQIKQIAKVQVPGLEFPSQFEALDKNFIADITIEQIASRLLSKPVLQSLETPVQIQAVSLPQVKDLTLKQVEQIQESQVAGIETIEQLGKIKKEWYQYLPAEKIILLKHVADDDFEYLQDAQVLAVYKEASVVALFVKGIFACLIRPFAYLFLCYALRRRVSLMARVCLSLDRAIHKLSLSKRLYQIRKRTGA